ncbi:MAG: alpha/beta hydrolase [Patescibacteria group bacterium]
MIDKQTLVILPGWGGNHDTWKECIEIAKSDFDVVCIDLPCFGTEPCPSTVWGVEEYTQFVKKKLAEVRSPNAEVILLGHSFGGQIAAYLAAMHPELIDKLILTGAAVFRPKRTLRRMFFGTIAKIGKIIFRLPVIREGSAWSKKVLYRAADSPDYSAASGIKREIFKKIIREDLTNILPNIKAKTLIIHGTHDSYVPVADAKKMAELIPHSRLEIIPNGKHGLHMQNPKKLMEAIHTFILSER